MGVISPLYKWGYPNSPMSLQVGLYVIWLSVVGLGLRRFRVGHAGGLGVHALELWLWGV